MERRYNRVLIKISGEAMFGAGSSGFDLDVVSNTCQNIKNVIDAGIGVSLVVGGGNFVRGRDWNDNEMVRPETVDAMGMLSTVINGILIRDVLQSKGVPAQMVSNLPLPFDVENNNSFTIRRIVQNGQVVIFVGGIGIPYFSTDTVSVVGALMSSCDVILKATQTDGVYDRDPKIHRDAVHLPEVTYADAISQRLGFMDETAILLASKKGIPIYVFSHREPNCLLMALKHEIRLSVVKSKQAT
ncbi:MAG: UMP kinase [Holosporales bacterium]|jgi:uridylate kinase|nr:UMP kinase [Holosporales bacterium]